MLHAFNGFNENNAVRLVTSEKVVGLSPPPRQHRKTGAGG